MKQCAGGLILKDKKILLTQRSKNTDSYPLFWTIPSGRGEEGESIEENAKREVKEETNLDFNPEKLYHQSEWPEYNRKLHRFLGTWSGEIKIQEEEVADYNWFTYTEAIELDLAFDTKEILEKLKKDNLIN